MAIISQETWDNMPENEKKKIREDYRTYCNEKINDSSKADFIHEIIMFMEDYFGKENLQPKPKNLHNP